MYLNALSLGAAIYPREIPARGIIFPLPIKKYIYKNFYSADTVSIESISAIFSFPMINSRIFIQACEILCIW